MAQNPFYCSTVPRKGSDNVSWSEKLSATSLESLSLAKVRNNVPELAVRVIIDQAYNQIFPPSVVEEIRLKWKEANEKFVEEAKKIGAISVEEKKEIERHTFSFNKLQLLATPTYTTPEAPPSPRELRRRLTASLLGIIRHESGFNPLIVNSENNVAVGFGQFKPDGASDVIDKHGSEILRVINKLPNSPKRLYQTRVFHGERELKLDPDLSIRKDPVWSIVAAAVKLKYHLTDPDLANLDKSLLAYSSGKFGASKHTDIDEQAKWRWSSPIDSLHPHLHREHGADIPGESERWSAYIEEVKILGKNLLSQTTTCLVKADAARAAATKEHTTKEAKSLKQLNGNHRRDKQVNK